MIKKKSIISFQYGKNEIIFIEPDPIDYISEQIKTNKKFYESELLEWLKNLKLPDGDFVDVGANIGNHTIYFSTILKRKTWAFEPYDKAFNLLKVNTELNGLKNIKAFNFGLGTENCNVNMVLPQGNNIGAAQVRVDEQGSSLLKKGDEALKGIKKIALMKIDVEGYEKEVLVGCLNTIKKHRPILLVECMDIHEFKKNASFLEDIGYHPRAVFGATPMIVFLPNIDLAKDINTPDILFTKYFETNDKFNRIRSLHLSASQKTTQQSDEIKSLSERVAVLKSSERKLRIRLNQLTSSRSYKLGRIITYPARKAKGLIK